MCRFVFVVSVVCLWCLSHPPSFLVSVCMSVCLSVCVEGIVKLTAKKNEMDGHAEEQEWGAEEEACGAAAQARVRV